jgi:hypothetical protein
MTTGLALDIGRPVRAPDLEEIGPPRVFLDMAPSRLADGFLSLGYATGRLLLQPSPNLADFLDVSGAITEHAIHPGRSGGRGSVFGTPVVGRAPRLRDGDRGRFATLATRRLGRGRLGVRRQAPSKPVVADRGRRSSVGRNETTPRPVQTGSLGITDLRLLRRIPSGGAAWPPFGLSTADPNHTIDFFIKNGYDRL